MAEHAPSTPAPAAPWPAEPHLLPTTERWALLIAYLQRDHADQPQLAVEFAAARDAGEDLDDLLADILAHLAQRRGRA